MRCSGVHSATSERGVRARRFGTGDGFTLVELMVVVLIIGILVAVAVPVFKNAKADAEANTCKANQRMMYGAIEAAKAEGKSVLKDGESFTTFFNPSYANYIAAKGSGWVTIAPTYLKAIPSCPSRLYSAWTSDSTPDNIPDQTYGGVYTLNHGDGKFASDQYSPYQFTEGHKL